jgi:hypothetical protein
MLKHNNIRVVTTGAAVVQVAGPNAFRVGIIVSVPDTNNPSLKFGEVAASNDGLRIPSGANMPWVLIFDKPNSMITSFISVQFPVATVFNMVEIMDVPG